MEAIVLLLKEYGLIAALVAAVLAGLGVAYTKLKDYVAKTDTKVDDLILEEVEKEVKDQIDNNE